MDKESRNLTSRSEEYSQTETQSLEAQNPYGVYKPQEGIEGNIRDIKVEIHKTSQGSNRIPKF